MTILVLGAYFSGGEAPVVREVTASEIVDAKMEALIKKRLKMSTRSNLSLSRKNRRGVVGNIGPDDPVWGKDQPGREDSDHRLVGKSKQVNLKFVMSKTGILEFRLLFVDCESWEAALD